MTRAEIEGVFAADPLEYPAYNKSEDRFSVVGPTLAGKMLFVVFTLRGTSIRVLTAYPARRKMRAQNAKYINGEAK